MSDTIIETNWVKLMIESRQVAEVAHRGQLYDLFDYVKHTDDVTEILACHGYTNEFKCAGDLHDGIEDGDLTYNKIRKLFGKDVAEMVLACTDPSDVRNRKDKKERVYQKLRSYKRGIPIKVADRIANFRHGIRMGNRDKVRMYVNEHEYFYKNLKFPDDNELNGLWGTLAEVVTKAQNEVKKWD